MGSVAMRGSRVPSFIVSYSGLPGTIDSMSSLPNPTPPTAVSLVNGRKYFQINCAVCHGFTGAGDGTMGTYSAAFKISLLSESARSRSDGYIYGMIRNGRGLMPTYNRVEDMDRWDIVNYIRGLQGRLADPVPTEKLGVPGETGDKVPGFTETAPTRPAPFFKFVPGGRAAPAADAARADSARARPTQAAPPPPPPRENDGGAA
jgi:mono/diheme cytochrome c family protein